MAPDIHLSEKQTIEKKSYPGLCLKSDAEEIYRLRREDFAAIISPMKLYDVSREFSLYDQDCHLLLHFAPESPEGL